MRRETHAPRFFYPSLAGKHSVSDSYAALRYVVRSNSGQNGLPITVAARWLELRRRIY